MSETKRVQIDENELEAVSGGAISWSKSQASFKIIDENNRSKVLESFTIKNWDLFTQLRDANYAGMGMGGTMGDEEFKNLLIQNNVIE